jgi:glutamate dehydrogenase
MAGKGRGASRSASDSKNGSGTTHAQVRSMLFKEAAEEDLAGLSRSDLDWIAGRAAEFLGSKRPGKLKIRLEDTGISSGTLAGRTVLEILNDDMPFLVDSVVNQLSSEGHAVHTVLHPVVTVQRDRTGKLKALLAASGPAEGAVRESYIHIHLDRLENEAARRKLVQDLEAVLAEVRAAVVDWQPMCQAVQRQIEMLRAGESPLPTVIVTESIDFLSWLLNNRFTFLGMMYCRVTGGGKQRKAEPVDKSALGILRLQSREVFRRGARRDVERYQADRAVLVEKSDLVSRVHRPVVMDYIGIYDYDASGNIAGELRIVGLFTSTAYNEAAVNIPILKRKIDLVMTRSGLSPSGHSGKGLLNVLETMARDDLFQIDADELLPLAMGMWRLQERPRTRLFVRIDRFSRYVIAYVYFPRDRFSSELREKAGSILSASYRGKVIEFLPDFGEGTLVRVRFIVRYGLHEGEGVDPQAVEREIIAATRRWDDELREALVASDNQVLRHLVHVYDGAFSPAYQAATPIGETLHDISEMEHLGDQAETGVEFMSARDDHGAVRLKLYHRERPVPLSARLPLLENMGLKALDENTHVIRPAHANGEERPVVYLHEVALDASSGSNVPSDAFDRLEDCFMAVWTHKADNDRLNALVLAAGIDWRQAAALRACARYLRQTGFPYTLTRIADTLCRYRELARLLTELFAARFNPGKAGNPSLAARDKAAGALQDKIEAALQDVPSLDDDRIIRSLAGMVMAITRTNYYVLDQLQGDIPIALAFKIRSKDVPGIPSPVPFAEIFVHSTLVEGVHLRGGKIARGGLRWSDRADDFRVEVLGLAKAQNVKNSVIVPVGAKGGFVPRQLPPGGSRDEIYAAGTLAYQSFVSSLLSVTDNADGSNVIPPQGIIRHDGDDPYLVVAADKGTAAFSDVANAISQKAGFWLDDAFASGGSAGYDHKKMGITARGGWEAVKRHFREVNRDIQTEPFTVVGVGDMSGDVFGNGMLLSEKTRLLAAFDHRDIFIDPDPDPATGFAERKRLFEMPRSSWQDYDRRLISKGGGVFSRSDKQITVTPEIQALLGLSSAKLTPAELMTAILQCEADLLWFGGIGTYVRASAESNADAGDKANDALRIAARQLRVKVIGEGANLGMTQLARIEYAVNGGRINTDAIDNSAGVNSSDVEVNLKIALGAAEASGKLTRTRRNKLLAAMTDEVAALVLRNNYLQTLCLSLAQRSFASDRAGLSRLFRVLESRGGLDRQIEFLPSQDELRDRLSAGGSLSRPELAVLVAYAKIVLFNDLLSGKLAGDAYLENELFRYFPLRMAKPYAEEIRGHKLRAEIVCTLLANSIVNRCGPQFLFDLVHDSGVSPASAALSYVLARDSFGFVDMNEAIDRLDCRIDGGRQLELYGKLQAGLSDAAVWFATNEDLSGGLSGLVCTYGDGLHEIAGLLPGLLPEQQVADLEGEQKELASLGVDDKVGRRIAGVRHLVRGLEVVRISRTTRASTQKVADAYFTLAATLGLDRILAGAESLASGSDYDRQAVDGISQTVQRAMRAITVDAVCGRLGKADNERITQAGNEVRRISEEADFTLAKFAVIASQINGLVKT